MIKKQFLKRRMQQRREMHEASIKELNQLLESGPGVVAHGTITLNEGMVSPEEEIREVLMSLFDHVDPDWRSGWLRLKGDACDEVEVGCNCPRYGDILLRDDDLLELGISHAVHVFQDRTLEARAKDYTFGSRGEITVFNELTQLRILPGRTSIGFEHGVSGLVQSYDPALNLIRIEGKDARGERESWEYTPEKLQEELSDEEYDRLYIATSATYEPGMYGIHHGPVRCFRQEDIASWKEVRPPTYIMTPRETVPETGYVAFRGFIPTE